MPYVVRLSDEAAADDLVESLANVSAELRRRGSRTIEVIGCGEHLKTELLFFLRAWKLSHPTVEFELDFR
jgi:hypothetical protein